MKKNVCFVQTFLVLMLLSQSACIRLSEGGRAVRLTSNPNLIKSCQFLTEIKVPRFSWGVDWSTRLKHETAKNQGNLVFSQGPAGESPFALGEAYYCKSLSSPPE